MPHQRLLFCYRLPCLEEIFVHLLSQTSTTLVVGMGVVVRYHS